MIRTMSRVLLGATMLAALALTGCQSSEGGKSEAAKPARTVGYFKVTGAKPENDFVIALKKPEQIEAARAIVSGAETAKVRVSGIVVPGKVAWNKPWSFYVDPDSISFFELGSVTCSAATSTVEARLSEVGGSFLPGRRWCPFSAKVSEEITVP